MKKNYKVYDNLLVDTAAESIGTHAVLPYSNRLAKKFTTNVYFSEVPVSLYKVVGDKILLPRAVCYGGEDHTVLGEKVEFTNKIVLRPKQKAPVAQAEKLLLRERPDNFILQADTGTGKTVMALHLIAKIGRPALVMVHRDFLMTDVWYKFAREIMGLAEEDIGFIQADKCDYKGKKLVIGMVHSLAKEERYPAEMYNYFGQVWFDEVERMGAELFSEAISKFPAKVRVGLSATPYRKDGRGVVFEAHIGPVKVVLKGLPMVPKVIVIKSDWKVPMVTWWGRYQPLPHEFGKIMHVNVKLVADYARNGILLKLITLAHKKDRNLIVFSELARDKHLNALKAKLIKHSIPEDDIGFLVGGMSKPAREIAMRKKVILSTYTYFGAGGDIPWADALILSTPRADVDQFIGRICREYPGKPTPVVFDIQDNDSHVLEMYGKSRLKQYRAKGAEIVYG